MQLIAVDIGNSAIKVVVQSEASDGRWCDQYVYRKSDPIQLELRPTSALWTICSVNQAGLETLKRWIQEHRVNDQVHVISESDITIRSNVESRSRVGCDRLISAWMALKLCDDQGPVVIVDAGTAVTIDRVNEMGIFEGGLIFPGATASLRQMSMAAEALPDLSSSKSRARIGNLERKSVGPDTESAILLGVYKSQLASMLSLVEEVSKSFKRECQVYATGGGILALEKYLPRSWKVVPDLVLKGVREVGSDLLGKDLT
ncbi:MAG: type III pantothenate kinase [Mariniblastus sp.]|nr:type III pantothenate kinase [Mariniblastus sp.]